MSNDDDTARSRLETRRLLLRQLSSTIASAAALAFFAGEVVMHFEPLRASVWVAPVAIVLVGAIGIALGYSLRLKSGGGNR